MTTVVLVLIMAFAATVLVGVLWSIVRALPIESANSRLRRDGIRATGTVVDNTMIRRGARGGDPGGAASW